MKNVDINALAYVLRKAQERAGGKAIVLFKSDVKHAYRLMPMHPLWQAMQTVRNDGKYYVDRCNCFGGSASGRIFHAFLFAGAMDRIGSEGIKDVLAHVDDNFSWEYASRKRFYKPYRKELPENKRSCWNFGTKSGYRTVRRNKRAGTVLTIVGP